MNIIIPIAGGAPSQPQQPTQYIRGLQEIRRKTILQYVMETLQNVPADSCNVIIRRRDAVTYHLDNIIGLVDVNGIQADGLTRSVMVTEPLDEKFRAFGFDVQRINGNSMSEVVTALDNALGSKENKPHIIICDTVPGTGLDFLIGNPKAHFISLDDEGWKRAFSELKKGEE